MYPLNDFLKQAKHFVIVNKHTVTINHIWADATHLGDIESAAVEMLRCAEKIPR